jgi:DNA-directed RNA polymerase specialized sigma24 family protein
MEHDILAFGQDLIAARPRLRQAAFNLTGRAHDAGHLVQETMDAAWRARDNFKAGANLDAWLDDLLRHRIVGEPRSFARRA